MSYVKDEWIRRAQEAAESDAEWHRFLVCYGLTQVKMDTLMKRGGTISDCLADIDFAEKFTCLCSRCGNSGWSYIVSTGDPVCESDDQVLRLEVECRAPSPSGSACGLGTNLHGLIPTSQWELVHMAVYGWLVNRNAAATLGEASTMSRKELHAKIFPIRYSDPPVAKEFDDTSKRDPDKFLEEQRDKNLRNMFG